MQTKNNAFKSHLIHAVQELLQKKTVRTQSEIIEMLQKQGIVANQVMISRVLHKIGAIKMNEDNQIVYRLPTELVTVSTKDPLKQLILNISHNESLIIIHAAPGSASLVARLLDQKNNLGILGTVAGDDTVFVAPEKTKQIKITFQKICKQLLS